MPNLTDNSLQGLVLGDSLTIFRTITNIPTGLTCVRAWFTLKPNESDDTPDDAAAIFQKEITIVDQPGVGHIVDAGSGTGEDRQCRVRFDLEPEDTFDLDQNAEYPWDIQLKLSNDWINTPFKGILKGVQGLTNKTA